MEAGCPGRWWSHHPFQEKGRQCTKGHSPVVIGMGWWLDHMIIVFFPTLMILWFWLVRVTNVGGFLYSYFSVYKTTLTNRLIQPTSGQNIWWYFLSIYLFLSKVEKQLHRVWHLKIRRLNATLLCILTPGQRESVRTQHCPASDLLWFFWSVAAALETAI